MYFPESETIARKQPDLQSVVELVDRQLAMIFASSPLHMDDFASLLGCDVNQVAAVFDLLAGLGVLRSEAMVECGGCFNLMRAADHRQAVEDEDHFECSICGDRFAHDAQVIVVYRMTTETLARPKPPVDCNIDLATLAALTSAENVFKRHGQMWIFKYRGEIRFMHDSRGLFYLARLLLQPMRDVPAISLLAAVTGIDPRFASGTSGPVLDSETIAKYRNLVNELEEDLKEASAHNDLGRIEKLQHDKEALENEIARAAGLGGRERGQSDGEKFRKSVSMAVKRAIDDIECEHKPLGLHLINTIDSGATFRYSPEIDPHWLI